MGTWDEIDERCGQEAIKVLAGPANGLAESLNHPLLISHQKRKEQQWRKFQNRTDRILGAQKCAEWESLESVYKMFFIGFPKQPTGKYFTKFEQLMSKEANPY